VDGLIFTAEMLFEVVNLRVAVVTGGDAIVGAGEIDLLELQSAVMPAGLGKSGLQKPAAAPAAKIIGAVRCHFDEILFTDTGFYHKPQIFGNRIAITLAHNLAGILDGKFNFQILVPVGIYLESALTDPFGVVFIDVLDDKVVLDVEFFQSCQD
jgi:hypothetical protein